MRDAESSESTPLGLNWGREISNREAKEEIAQTVASLAVPGDTVGIGSGSTSFLTTLALGSRVGKGLKVKVVPTSIEIELACHALGLDVVHSPIAIDWCFDGADEVDPSGNLIKGRGGALHRERQIFIASPRRIVVADSSKSVGQLGEKFPIPIEVEPELLRYVHQAIGKLENVSDVQLRMAVAKDGPVVTESGRVLLDVRMSHVDLDTEAELLRLPGVCCTGIFMGFEFERIGDER